MKIEITRNGKRHMKCPFLSGLDNLNDELKKYSSEYILSVSDGYVIHKERRENVIGDVFSKIESVKELDKLKTLIPSETILVIYPDAVYVAMNKLKKQLKDIIFKENRIFITLTDMEEAINIGKIYFKETDEYKDMMNSLSKFLEYHQEVLGDSGAAKFTILNESQIFRIEESILKCSMNDYTIRLTKQLVPGISNKMDVSLFLDIPRAIKTEDGEVCPLYVRTEKADVVSYLVYKIIKY